MCDVGRRFLTLYETTQQTKVADGLLQSQVTRIDEYLGNALVFPVELGFIFTILLSFLPL
jgi:hypothetical protein